MENSVEIARVIDLSSQLKSSIVELKRSYESLIPLLEKEHDAIAHRNLLEMQEIGKLKGAIGSKVEFIFEASKKNCSQLSSIYEKLSGEKWRTGIALTEISKMLSEISTIFIDTSGVSSKVLQFLIKEIDILSVEFRNVFDKVQPDIERNRTILITMLQSHRQSYSFWSEVANEEAASYNQTGAKKSKGQTSLFQVRA